MKYSGLEGGLFGAALVFFACSGGPDQGPIAGPGPGPTEPGEGIERGDNPFDFASANASVNAAAVTSTGSGMCTTCADLIGGEAVMSLCPGSELAISALGDCACSGICNADCSQSICTGMGLDASCASCLTAECPSALQDCQEN